ncbi:MAG: exosome complex exonuclease Rrp41 [Nanoarchaeota archaeon]
MYNKRPDNRKFDELREISAEVSVIPRADGSAMFKIGKTVAIAAVYGPKDLFPRFLRDPKKGILRCNYNMMSFSGSGERIRPGPSRRSKEISFITEKALSPVLDLTDFPGSVVDIFIELIQTDGGTRCAGITAAALALADAGFPMKDLVSAVSIGRIEDKIVVDVSKEEEDYEKGMADIPVAIMPRNGNITLLQMDGLAKPSELKEALKVAKRACEQIYKVQKDALKARYKK